MVKNISQPAVYSFVGNDVKFVFTTDSPDPFDINININGYTISLTTFPYSKNNVYYAEIHIGDILQSAFNEFVPVPETDDIIYPIFGFTIEYQVTVGGYLFNGIAFKGGITNEAFVKLAEKNMNIFTYRLRANFEQFLFTTRTNGKEIRLKETELYPFVFIHPGINIHFKSESGNTIIDTKQPAGTLCAMNFKTILDRFETDFVEKTTEISVNPAGQYAFKIIIDQERISEEKYLIKFRNSLGAYEMLEVVGRNQHSVEFDEEQTFNKLNVYDFYEEKRDRTTSVDIINVETGYKTRNEIPFILDLIKSEEAYFYYPDGTYLNCLVTAETYEYMHMMTRPTSIPLKVRKLTNEIFSTPHFDPGTLLQNIPVLGTEDGVIIVTEDNKHVIKVY